MAQTTPPTNYGSADNDIEISGTAAATTQRQQSTAKSFQESLKSLAFSILYNNNKPRQYIVDRCHGHSKYGTRHPPMRCCRPLPVVARRSDWLEQNAWFERVGRIGIRRLSEPNEAHHTEHDRLRRNVFCVALLANLIAFALNLFALMAVSTQFDLLEAASFSTGIVSASSPSDNNNFTSLGIYIGLRAIAFENRNDDPDLTSSGAYTFEEFCSSYDSHLRGLVSDETCAECAETSSGLVASVTVGMLTIFPSMFTDINRMYSNYDINCQEFFGVVVSSISMLVSMFTFLNYNQTCYKSFYQGSAVTFFYNGTRDMNDAVVIGESGGQVLFDWIAGNGLVAMYMGTSLKCIDIVANLLIPTPTITRNHEEQMEYEAMYGPGSSKRSSSQQDSLEIAMEQGGNQ